MADATNFRNQNINAEATGDSETGRNGLLTR